MKIIKYICATAIVLGAAAIKTGPHSIRRQGQGADSFASAVGIGLQHDALQKNMQHLGGQINIPVPVAPTIGK